MLDFSDLNVIAIVAVWVMYLVIGALWYSPIGFAKKWTQYTGIDIMKIPTGKANQIIGFIAVSCLIQVATLAVIINSLAATSISEGLQIGLLLWLGLTTATTVGVTFYSNRGWKFLMLNSAYFLVVMSLGSMILAYWA